MKQFLFWILAFIIVGGIPAIWKEIICNKYDKYDKFMSENEWIYVVWWIVAIIFVWFILMPFLGFEFKNYNFEVF